MELQSSSPVEPTSARSRINTINPSASLLNVNGVQASDDHEGGNPSGHLAPQSLDGTGVGLPDRPVPGIRRRSTLPVSSQVHTPEGSGNTQKGPLEPLRSGTGDPSSANSSDDSSSEDRPFSDDALEVMQRLSALVGLENVKSHFKELGMYVHNSKVLKLESHDERYHALFQGNPGTGKMTVAKLYAEFLKSIGVVDSDKMVERSGAKLASEGPRAILKMFEDEDGGVLFVDEAYQLVTPHSGVAGKQVLDVILEEMDKNPPRWVVIFAGYKEEFEPFFSHNDGLSSRIPQILTFEDFPKAELHEILLGFFHKRFYQYRSLLEIEGGPRGPFVNAVVNRIFQGHGKRGFSNARSVRAYFQNICQRHARRLGQLDSPTIKDRLFFTKEDLLGPKPVDLKATSKSWAKLKSLVGLHEVKKSVEIMFKIVDTNYQRELKGTRPHTHSLNRVFVGSPGTGKMTVAKLYGKILAELGFLSKGDVVIKTPADFIGNAVGMSESNTRTILASTLGKVLIIDEAYMLDPGDATTTRDSFKTAVLDTIVAEVQGNPGDDRCVLLLGYEDKMESLFQNGNPGLSGRFMADMPFRFADFSADELGKILKDDLRVRQINYKPTCLGAAIDQLSRFKYKQNFSNAREVKVLVSEAVLRNQERNMAVQDDDQDFDACLEPQDFDPWLRPQTATTGNVINCRVDLTGIISEPVIEQLERYLPGSVKRELNRHIPRTFVFKGPPGTGKATLAAYMGKFYRDLGLLPTTQVVLCSAVNFIGQHVGQTTPKTRMQLEKGLGKVLIIRDIDRLTKGGYSNEALDEITSFVRSYSGRMAIVLTGPESVDELLDDRHELGAMFQDRITFENLSPRDCLKLLDRMIHELEPPAETPFFVSQAATERFEKAISILCMFEGRGNASLVRVMKSRMILKGDAELYLVNAQDPGRKHRWKLTEVTAMSCIKDLFHEIRDAGAAVRKTVSGPPPAPTAPPPDSSATHPSEATSEATSKPAQPVHLTHKAETAVKETAKATGDQGVAEKSNQLGKMAAKTVKSVSLSSKTTEEQREEKDKSLKDDEAKKSIQKEEVAEEPVQKEEVAEEPVEKEEVAEESVQKEEVAKEPVEKEEVAEESVQKEEVAEEPVEKEEVAEEPVKVTEKSNRLKSTFRSFKVRGIKNKEKDKSLSVRFNEVKKESVQKAMKNMGKCEEGYDWDKVPGGYECQGGAHSMSDAEAEAAMR